MVLNYIPVGCPWPFATQRKLNLPSCVARLPLCHKVNLPSSAAWRPLCHKVNLPWSEARRRNFILTCDIFGTGQKKILALCYLFGKTYKPTFRSATQVTEINTLDQITENWYWREPHIPLEALIIPLKCVREISEPVLKHNSLCSSVHHKKCGLGSLISTQVEKNCQWTVSFYSKFQ